MMCQIWFSISDQHFSKKSVSAPHRTSQFFEKNSPHRTSPHIIIFLPHPHRTHTPPHIRNPLKNMCLEDVLCAVQCGCRRKIMMWGEVQCGEIFSKNCEVWWGVQTLFFEYFPKVWHRVHVFAYKTTLCVHLAVKLQILHTYSQ